jgi:ABC-type multidrug transport system ATPase subunit
MALDIARQPDNLRRVLGYLPQDFGVYPNLNAVEFLSYLAKVSKEPSGCGRAERKSCAGSSGMLKSWATRGWTVRARASTRVRPGMP